MLTPGTDSCAHINISHLEHHPALLYDRLLAQLAISNVASSADREDLQAVNGKLCSQAVEAARRARAQAANLEAAVREQQQVLYLHGTHSSQLRHVFFQRRMCGQLECRHAPMLVQRTIQARLAYVILLSKPALYLVQRADDLLVYANELTTQLDQAVEREGAVSAQ